MSQHDMTIDNAPGATVRADINAALAALVSNSAGATAPTTTYAHQLWADTTAGKLKIRNASNTAWLDVMTLADAKALTAAAADTAASLTGNTPAAILTAALGSGTADAGKVLRGDRVWADMAGAGGYNYSGTLTASAASNALTVSASGGSVTFRSGTLTSGAQNTRSVGNPSITLSAGSTLGFTANELGRIYIYALDNGGTVELALCRVGNLNEAVLHNTTAEGGAGGADSASTLYSATARSNVPIRLMGVLEITTGSTAGNWSNQPSMLSPFGPGVHRTGDIIQTVTATKTDTFSWTGTAWTDIPGLSVSLTPRSAASKIALRFDIGTMGAVNQTAFRFDRNGTAIGLGDAAGSRLRVTSSQAGALNIDHSESCTGSYLDSPASTSALTYKLQASHQYNSGYAGHINRSVNDGDTTHQGYARTISSITATEICA